MPENTSPSESPERQDERYDRQMFRILRNIDLNLLTIFEAVYVHKGIVNAAKILNITPSAISQSINKLRALFPDPLFIRKGQGVMPTAYATHLHQYISRGMEAFLSALDIAGSPHQQRVITIATTPGMGALLIPIVSSALKPAFPQILLHNIAITDAARQLDQRQVDLLIDTHLHSGQAISHHVLGYGCTAVLSTPRCTAHRMKPISLSMNLRCCFRKASATPPFTAACRKRWANDAADSAPLTC